MRKVICLFVLLLALPLVAGVADAAPCDPTGTWYGGSDWKWMGTITANPDGSYTQVFQPAFDLTALGIPAGTTISGTLVRRGRALFEQQAIMMLVVPPNSDPNTPPTLELDVVHGFMRLVNGCDTLENTIDVYGGYVPWTEDKVPFVTPVDGNWLPAAGVIRETYHRMKVPR